MIVIETLFAGFINIVLHVISTSTWLVYLILAAFVMAFIAGLVYSVYNNLGGL